MIPDTKLLGGEHKGLGQAVVIRANWGWWKEMGFPMMWATWSDEANTSTLSSTGTWARMRVCLHACLWVHVGPVRAGLRARRERMELDWHA